MTACAYVFRTMSAADLPLMQRWLAAPHVAEWWGEPGEQFELVRGDLDEPAMDQFIVEMDGRPFAYLQCYALTDWNMGFGAQPGGTRGIDLLIGDAGMTGRGHGRAFIRAFADRVLAGGSPRVVTDPDPANERAIHVYEQAGFVKDGMVDTPDGVSLLMVRNA